MRSEQHTASEASLGLVNSSTSPTRVLFRPPAGAFEIDAQASRLRRMRTGVLTWARCVSEWTPTTGRRWWCAMVTLTYGPRATWEARHISQTLACLGEWARRHKRLRGLRLPYTWVLELTQAGVPHYHLLVWLPVGTQLPKFDRRGWWRHGHTRVEAARNAVGYIAKYASKGVALTLLGEVPRGARLSGRGGLPRQCMQAREARWWRLPGWLRERFPLAAARDPSMLGLVRRIPAAIRGIRDGSGRLFGWLSEAGELLATPWASGWCPVTRRVFVWRIAV